MLPRRQLARRRPPSSPGRLRLVTGPSPQRRAPLPRPQPRSPRAHSCYPHVGPLARSQSSSSHREAAAQHGSLARLRLSLPAPAAATAPPVPSYPLLATAATGSCTRSNFFSSLSPAIRAATESPRTHGLRRRRALAAHAGRRFCFPSSRSCSIRHHARQARPRGPHRQRDRGPRADHAHRCALSTFPASSSHSSLNEADVLLDLQPRRVSAPS